MRPLEALNSVSIEGWKINNLGYANGKFLTAAKKALFTAISHNWYWPVNSTEGSSSESRLKS